MEPITHIMGTGETADLLARHQTHLTRLNLRPSTIYQRRRVLLRLHRQTPAVRLLDLTAEEIAVALDARDLQPHSKAVELCHLRSFYGWAVDAHLLERNPAADVPRPKVPRRLPRPMPDTDKQRAIKLAPERVRPILILAAYAGLRAGEIAQLHWFGTKLYRKSRDLRVTQEAMRHRSPVSTAIYTWVGASDVARVVDKLPA